MTQSADTTRFQLDDGHPLVRMQRPALIVGVVAAAAAALGGFLSPEQFFPAYLFAYLFWFGLAMGSLAILMIQYITGGAWGAVIRRILEASIGTLPLLLILFVPILLGMGHLYEWTHADHVAHDPLLQHKSPFLNVPFFLVRSAFYFAAWMLLIRYLVRWSRVEDEKGPDAVGLRLEYASRGGLLLHGLVVTFASVDWAMSTEPHWYSTMYGLLIAGGQVLSAFAFVIPVLLLLVQTSPFRERIAADQFHDLGKLMLAFVIIWAYFAFSQYLIVWSGDLPEETPWYLHRAAGGWQYIAIALIAVHFALPLILLLSRALKRNPRVLAQVAILVLVMRVVDLYWTVMPAFDTQGVAVHWIDVATLIGIGGIWLAAFSRRLQGRAMLPLRDPSLPAAEVSA